MGGLSTKIHTTVDALGNPTSVALTEGQKHDLEGADLLLPDIKSKIVIADKGYDADKRVIEPLLRKGQIPVIPSRAYKKERFYDKDLYKTRHLIENFFAKLKQYRGIATRYDKLAKNFLSAIYLVSSAILLI